MTTTYWLTGDSKPQYIGVAFGVVELIIGKLEFPLIYSVAVQQVLWRGLEHMGIPVKFRNCPAAVIWNKRTQAPLSHVRREGGSWR